MQPRVSVVIPCYRQAHFLRDAIESALGQTLAPHQVVVVDDGSPDGVRDVVQAHPGVEYVGQRNLGLGSARNAGLARCTGELVVFLDADDRLLPDGLKIGAEAHAARPGCSLAWGRSHLIDQGGARLLSDSLPTPRRPAHYLNLLRGNLIGPPAAVMFRRSALEAVGGYWTLTVPAEDWDLYLRLVRHEPAFYHGEFVAEYRRHRQNMSNDLDRMLEGKLVVLGRQETLGPAGPGVRRAIRRSRRNAIRGHDRARRVAALSRHTRAGRWGQALGTAGAMFVRHPGTIGPVLVSLARKLRRAWAGPAAP